LSTRLKQVRQKEHPNCIVCGEDNELGFKLDFSLTEEGGVEAFFKCSKDLEGYRSILHGGIISALLDGAMTNCLFAHGIRAMTAKLNVIFLLPVDTEIGIRLRAMIQRSWSRFYVLKSELSQNDIVKATGSAIFVRTAQIEPAVGRGVTRHDDPAMPVNTCDVK